MPVLASLAVPKESADTDLWIIRLLKRAYRPILSIAMSRPGFVAVGAILVLALSIPVALNLGGEFIPRLEEGDLLVEGYRLPSATLENAAAMTQQIERTLMRFPEVKTVFCKTGRPEIANDVMGVHETDIWIMLKDVEEWPEKKTHDELVESMSDALNSEVPGVAFAFTQPIEMHVDELVAGVKADVAVLLYGDDLDELNRASKEVERVLKNIDGAEDVKADYQEGLPTVRIRPRPEKLAQHGIDAKEVMDVVSAIGGRQAGVVYEGRARFPIIVRLPEKWRENIYLLQQLPVGKPGINQSC